MSRGQIAVQSYGELAFLQRPLGHSHRLQHHGADVMGIGIIGRQRQSFVDRRLGDADLLGPAGRRKEANLEYMRLGDANKCIDTMVVEPKRHLE